MRSMAEATATRSRNACWQFAIFAELYRARFPRLRTHPKEDKQLIRPRRQAVPLSHALDSGTVDSHALMLGAIKEGDVFCDRATVTMPTKDRGTQSCRLA